MNIYFLIIIIVYALNIGISIAKHGKPQEGKYNFLTTLIGACIGIFITYMAIKIGF